MDCLTGAVGCCEINGRAYLTLKILKLFWGSSINCLMAKCILCLFLEKKQENISGGTARLLRKEKPRPWQEEERRTRITETLQTQITTYWKQIFIQFSKTVNTISHPENRSRGQYRLRLFHFPLATWTENRKWRHNEGYFMTCRHSFVAPMTFFCSHSSSV